MVGAAFLMILARRVVKASRPPLGRVLDRQRLATDPDGGPFAGECWEGDDGELDLPPLQAALREAERVYKGVRPHQALGYRPPIASLATLPPPHL